MSTPLFHSGIARMQGALVNNTPSQTRLSGKPRLLLADNLALVLEGLCKLLEQEFTIVGTVGDGPAAVAAFQRLSPDVLVLDIALPLLNGIEVARQVKATSPSARIIFLTARMEGVSVEEALRAGASGYALKQDIARELVAGIHTVLAGETYISPRIKEHVGQPLVKGSDGAQRSPLTDRQLEVLQLIAEGKTMKEIGKVLGISARTAEFHKSAIVEHLGLRTTAELTRYVLHRGEVDGDREQYRHAGEGEETP